MAGRYKTERQYVAQGDKHKAILGAVARLKPPVFDESANPYHVGQMMWEWVMSNFAEQARDKEFLGHVKFDLLALALDAEQKIDPKIKSLLHLGPVDAERGRVKIECRPPAPRFRPGQHVWHQEQTETLLVIEDPAMSECGPDWCYPVMDKNGVIDQVPERHLGAVVYAHHGAMLHWPKGTEVLFYSDEPGFARPVRAVIADVRDGEYTVMTSFSVEVVEGGYRQRVTGVKQNQLAWIKYDPGHSVTGPDNH
jgi:hypothetical protein